MKYFRKRIVSLYVLSPYDLHKPEKHHKNTIYLLVLSVYVRPLSNKIQNWVEIYNVIKAKF